MRIKCKSQLREKYDRDLRKQKNETNLEKTCAENPSNLGNLEMESISLTKKGVGILVFFNSAKGFFEK